MIKKISLHDTFRNAMLSNSKGSRKEQFEAFLETMESNKAYLTALATDYFDREFAKWKLERVGKAGSLSLVATAPKQQTAEQRQARKQEFEREYQAKKPAIIATILLNLEMPNGKRLRDCTGADLNKFGGFYTELARHMKPTEIVDKKFSEADLKRVYSRFTSGKRGRIAANELRVS
jgi:hypothetical protein